MGGRRGWNFNMVLDWGDFSPGELLIPGSCVGRLSVRIKGLNHRSAGTGDGRQHWNSGVVDTRSRSRSCVRCRRTRTDRHQVRKGWFIGLYSKALRMNCKADCGQNTGRVRIESPGGRLRLKRRQIVFDLD